MTPKGIELINGVLAYLNDAQSDNGGFVSYSSDRQNDFSGAKTSPSIFSSALILGCLGAVPAAQPLRARLANYLLTNRSPDGAWNYLEREPPRIDGTFPNDMDDTACAIGGIARHQASFLTPEILAGFTNALLATEVKAGGPYQTWIINLERYPQWDNVDLVVNANIGWALTQLDVSLPALQTYVKNQIASGSLTSSFYKDPITVMYFLSRYLQAAAPVALRKEVTRAVKQCNEQTPLLLVVQLLSTTYYLSATEDNAQLMKVVSQHLKDHNLPAYGFYLDPAKQGRQYYGGSSALTAAFVIEALSLHYLASPASPLPSNEELPLLKKRHRSVSSTSNNAFKSSYEAARNIILSSDKDGLITRIADHTSALIGEHLPRRVINYLNSASIHGWLAYDIYDDVLDNASDPTRLSIAHFAIRHMLSDFQRALPLNRSFPVRVQQLLTTLDQANHWEVTNTRFMPADEHNKVPLPAYGPSLDKLWQRSAGHMLAPLAVFEYFSLNHQSKEQKALQQFFKHYLIARQLNDDAHDWEADLVNGQLTYVVTYLLNQASPDNTYAHFEPADLPALQKLFWESTITDMSDIINHHIAMARTALISTPRFRAIGSAYLDWLTTLTTASTQAVTESMKTRAFLQALHIP